MLKNKTSVRFVILALLFWSFISSICVTAVSSEEGGWSSGLVVKREQRRRVVSTEYGEITAVRIGVGSRNGSYLLHSFTLEPNALFLPVMLHADMVFYVHTGSGKLSWTEDDDLKSTNLVRGDVYRLQAGSVFFVQSDLKTTDTERQKLRIHAIFSNSNFDLHEPLVGPYSSIRDLVTGFDRKVLQAAFRVPSALIDELLNGTTQPAFIHGVTSSRKNAWNKETEFLRTILGRRTYDMFEFELNKKKKDDADLFNIFKEDKGFENSNGWSTAVTRKQLSALEGTNIGVFMVNLTVGSMMGPHWNPIAAEIAMVLEGQGMVRVVCANVLNATSCKNMRFHVKEGDVFAVPRFHPMTQISFNNETLVFMGFSTSTEDNHPQYLAGQASALRTLDKDVLAIAFNVSNTTLDRFFAPQTDSVILACTSCAEEELRIMQVEMEKEMEEIREKEREAEREREEQKRIEREEARKAEEAAAKKEEEERKKREQEAEAAKQEAEAKKKQEEEAARQKAEAEARKKQEEEAARQKAEAEAKRKQEEEERKRQEKEAQEEAERQRQEAEAAAQRERERQKAEEEAAKQEEQRRQQEAQEAERQRQEAEAAAERERERQKQEAEAAAQREREGQKAEEETARQEEQRRQQEAQEAERQRQEAEAEAQRERARQEAEKQEQQRREAEAAAQRERESQEAEEEAARQTEQRRQQEQVEAERQRQEAEAAAQRERDRQRQEAEAAAQRERERQTAEEEAARQEEQRRQQEQQEAETQRQEAEAAAQRERQQAEEAAARQEEQSRQAQQEAESQRHHSEEEAARSQEEQRQQSEAEETAARRARQPQEGDQGPIGGYSWLQNDMKQNRWW